MPANAFDMNSWLAALYALLAFGVVGWLISLLRRDVSIVDSMWSLMFLIATATYAFLVESPGGWWAIASPALMTFLLLRVSGVAMLEKGIGKRRPQYADYIKRTNAFFPGPPGRGMSV